MVSGIKGLGINFAGSGNYSSVELNSIESEVQYADTDKDGNFTTDATNGFSTQTNNAIGSFGDNKNVFTQKISELLSDQSKVAQKPSKEVAPNMDLSLDDIPSPPKV